MDGVLILGAGGHGLVVADTLLCQNVPLLGFLDDDPALHGETRLGLPVLGAIAAYELYKPSGLVLGVGDTTHRERIVRNVGPRGRHLWHTAIHPRATIARSARLGVGVTIFAGAVVNPGVILGDHAAINTGATVDHECVIGAYGHIAPGAHLAGGVCVGRGTLVGIGACVRPGCSIGEWAIVGAGAAVVRDVPDRVTAVGVPARWRRAT